MDFIGWLSIIGYKSNMIMIKCCLVCEAVNIPWAQIESNENECVKCWGKSGKEREREMDGWMEEETKKYDMHWLKVCHQRANIFL